jgi:hypothetical protein
MPTLLLLALSPPQAPWRPFWMRGGAARSGAHLVGGEGAVYRATVGDLEQGGTREVSGHGLIQTTPPAPINRGWAKR